MNAKTASLLQSLNSPSVMDLLQFYGNDLDYHSYSSNTHSTNETLKAQELDKLCKKLYIDYRNNILEADQKNILNPNYKTIAETLKKNEFDPNTMSAKGGTPFYDFISKDFEKLFGTLKDVLNIAEEQTGFGMTQNSSDDFFHVFTYQGMGIPRGDTDARLYLNLKEENILKFSEEFYDRARKQGLPTYFKFSNNDARNDTWLVYSSYDNLDKYVDIIEGIKKDRPELLEGTDKISPNMAKFNGYIGYGEEPKKMDSNGKELYAGESYNTRLSNMFDEIYNDVKMETKTITRNARLIHFADNNEKFGNSGITFKEYWDNLTSPTIENYVDSWLKTSKGKAWLKKSKLNTRTKAIEDVSEEFEKGFSKYLSNNEELTDLQLVGIGMEGLVIPLSKYKNSILANLKKPLANKKITNETELKGQLNKYAMFKDSKSNNYENLRIAMTREIFDWTARELKNDPTNQTLIDLNKEYHDPSGRITNTGHAIVSNAMSSFVSDHNFLVKIDYKGQTIDISNKINRYKLCEAVVGKDRVEAIAKEKCIAKNVNFEKVSFNDSTVAQITGLANPNLTAPIKTSNPGTNPTGTNGFINPTGGTNSNNNNGTPGTNPKGKNGSNPTNTGGATGGSNTGTNGNGTTGTNNNNPKNPTGNNNPQTNKHKYTTQDFQDFATEVLRAGSKGAFDVNSLNLVGAAKNILKSMGDDIEIVTMSDGSKIIRGKTSGKTIQMDKNGKVVSVSKGAKTQSTNQSTTNQGNSSSTIDPQDILKQMEQIFKLGDMFGFNKFIVGTPNPYDMIARMGMSYGMMPPITQMFPAYYPGMFGSCCYMPGFMSSFMPMQVPYGYGFYNNYSVPQIVNFAQLIMSADLLTKMNPWGIDFASEFMNMPEVQKLFEDFMKTKNISGSNLFNMSKLAQSSSKGQAPTDEFIKAFGKMFATGNFDQDAIMNAIKQSMQKSQNNKDQGMGA